MKKLIRQVLDGLSVRFCIVCGKPVKIRDDINLCEKCADKISNYGQTIHTADRIVASRLPYEKHIRRHIIKFKFRNKKYLGYTFAKLLYERLIQYPWISEIQSVTCVPMKGRNRAYNQSAVVAEHVAELMNVPFKENALIKIKNNPPFYTLTLKQRLKAVKGAYSIGDDKSFVGERILLIDDIYTTGATIGECRHVLLKGGADCIYCATVCYHV